MVFDHASKNHLTTANGVPNINDYTSSAKTYHGKNLKVNSTYKDLDMGVHKLMKTTTYSIGKKG
jgi:hypothetical protein